MPRIQQLPPLVVNQIAAGEVIERPASVVKELLENSLDAGARRIEVDVEQGGAELIRVVDDGGGIAPDDLPLALSPHATSKLQSADDLFRIGTFGFRGEALASIGGVAQVTIQSRQAGSDSGACISCHGSDLSPVRPWNGAPGTRVEVRHLFFNTPVRRKFLKQPATEMGHVSEAVTRLALAHPRWGDAPGLHVVLRHNNKGVHDLPATATLFDRVGTFYGPDVQGALYGVEAGGPAARLAGFVADPSCDRGTARMQYLFVNGRWVRDRSLGHAVQEAYRGLLMTGRYAVCFLFLDLPPDQVDVNVHPTKSEVRFRNASAAHHLVFTAVRARLRQANLTPRLQVPAAAEIGGPAADAPPSAFPPPPAFVPPAFVPPADARPLEDFRGGEVPPGDAGPEADTIPFAPAALPRALPPLAGGDRPATFGPPSPAPPFSAPSRPGPPPGLAAAFRGASAPSLLPDADASRVIQLYDCYLVLETEQGMLVIDQHALHERILFEQFQRRIRAGSLETQALLIPEPIDLPPDQAARLLEQREALADLGLGVEGFGGATVLLTRYPALLGKRSPRGALLAVADHLATQDRLPAREVLFNHLLSLMACHSAVRSGERLTPEQMHALLAQRALADDTHHCPHGRPTALLFSRQDLERQFRRA